ncbi:hypothetical protein HanRHA438_Chr15g0693971 [Helianthus annuus]|uniref:Uncharacterized protein n=1 Tax=Helianthus annuus TaxID=4232 RepID=A0A9K3DYP3_HELAN|nr:hypothetical protein HanXRQr2_Chr15g0681911 [Helianthus annuus]KAJ0450383.1 hypothetical protein HanHA300_Chr15g0555701 [Helianthus annuus]KAJ0472214.1 hypothetical protein HanHA89_Chr15g0604501 [Helianthus annuus]KAJ0647811.1 hypothetical protein HanLR1_Chr15g0565821 [Helianthus annuus]KAJ0651676.1 hypothetical protein HanOQP8_Chr15g0563541 [Helianthus annuus]
MVGGGWSKDGGGDLVGGEDGGGIGYLFGSKDINVSFLQQQMARGVTISFSIFFSIHRGRVVVVPPPNTTVSAVRTGLARKERWSRWFGKGGLEHKGLQASNTVKHVCDRFCKRCRCCLVVPHGARLVPVVPRSANRKVVEFV